ncbi:MAG: DNA-binding protein [Prevotella sp.]|nr:DNA-binding protein [Prevotella sp.]
MSLFIKKYQNNNKEMKNAYGKWYGRAVIMDKVQIEDLASEIEDNCTVKRADILAVLSELGPAIKKEVQRSLKVTIPYLGSFKLGVRTTGAETMEEFDIKKNVKGVRVLFYPETKADGNRMVKELTRGVRVAELPKNATYLEEDDEAEAGTDSGQQQGGGTSGSVEEQP